MTVIVSEAGNGFLSVFNIIPYVGIPRGVLCVLSACIGCLLLPCFKSVVVPKVSDVLLRPGRDDIAESVLFGGLVGFFLGGILP